MRVNRDEWKKSHLSLDIGRRRRPRVASHNSTSERTLSVKTVVVITVAYRGREG